MNYFESGLIYESAPKWVETALTLGYALNSCSRNIRRIAMVSMPFQSEIAGIIALGALRYDLECEKASITETYFETLSRACRDSIASRKKTKDTIQEPAWDVRKLSDNTCWRFVGFDNESIKIQYANHRAMVKRRGKYSPNQNGPCESFIMRSNAVGWQLREYPIPQAPQGGAALDAFAYNALPNCPGIILKKNLISSYDGLVLVGNGVGRESYYIRRFYQSGFVMDGNKIQLGDLLTLNQDQRNGITRLRFINERSLNGGTYQIASLVVADGVSALLKAERHFPHSDIIGVCSRDSPVENIAHLRDFLSEKIRYYEDVEVDKCLRLDKPAWMLLRLLQKRV